MPPTICLTCPAWRSMQGRKRLIFRRGLVVVVLKRFRRRAEGDAEVGDDSPRSRAQGYTTQLNLIIEYIDYVLTTSSAWVCLLPPPERLPTRFFLLQNSIGRLALSVTGRTRTSTQAPQA